MNSESASTSTRLEPIVMPVWLRQLMDNVRRASKAFKTDADWPDAWLMLGDGPPGTAAMDWYDWTEPLLGRPVFHSPAWLQHSGYDGDHQMIVPLWFGDIGDKGSIQREFECRLAGSGDFAA